MQQKIQSSFGCTQPGKAFDVGEFPDVEAGSLPMSHTADTTPQNDELQPAADHRRIEKNPDGTKSSVPTGFWKKNALKTSKSALLS